MKRVLLTLAVVGTIFLSGCEKDQALLPEEKASVKAGDVIMCTGCGKWDIEDPEPEPSAMRAASPTTDSTKVESPSAKPGNRKK